MVNERPTLLNSNDDRKNSTSFATWQWGCGELRKSKNQFYVRYVRYPEIYCTRIMDTCVRLYVDEYKVVQFWEYWLKDEEETECETVIRNTAT